MDQTIDLERLKNNKEVRSVRSRESMERDKKILQAQTDLISERYIYFLVCAHYFRIILILYDIL